MYEYFLFLYVYKFLYIMLTCKYTSRPHKFNTVNIIPTPMSDIDKLHTSKTLKKKKIFKSK